MDDKIYKDIHFDASENDNFFDVEEKIVYGFFLFRTFKSKSGLPFSIRRIYAPNYYTNENLNLIDIISITFVFPIRHERPFVLILDYPYNSKDYYGMENYSGITWESLYKLNLTQHKISDRLVLDTLKKLYVKFFSREIWLDGLKIKRGSFISLNIKYDIVSEDNYCKNYDRHRINPEKTFSISRILINQEAIELDRSLKFVEHFYFYYVHDEYSTPLMMETVDYQIGGSLPYINYFIPESVGNKWVPVDCGTDLLEPKCKSDIKSILDGVVEMYRNHPVTIDINYPKYNSNYKDYQEFGGHIFNYMSEVGKYYGSYSYEPKATKSFFIENIMLDGVRQDIDVQSTEFESITVYYKVEEPHRPLLICLKLHNKTKTSVEKFKWFYIPHFDKNVWLKLDFEAHPHNDKILIEQKIKSIYGSTFLSYIMIPVKWLTIFALISTLLTFLLIKQRRRLRLILFRLYHHIRI